MIFMMIVPILGILLVSLFFFLMKHFSIWRLYLALASFAGLIGMIIGLGTLAYEGVRLNVISDDEYLVGYNRYYNECSDYELKAGKTKESCLSERNENAIKSRHYEAKDTMIGGGVWGSVFLIVFLLHFPFFLKSRKEND